MFFFEKLRSIRSEYKVLEVGPGATPHPRSDAFLELDFLSNQDKIMQRGGGLKEADFGDKPIYYYGGGPFPFKNNQFDYVICSHVVEHVSNPEEFLSEIFRVGSGRGYLEYPMLTYEYLYDFDVHLHFVKFDFDRNVMRYLPKKETSFHEFAGVSALFYKTLEQGWDDMCAANKNFFFEGVEFNQPFLVEKTRNLALLLPSQSLISPKTFVRKLLSKLFNKTLS
jgi:SAM-dependent methyltransferase